MRARLPSEVSRTKRAYAFEAQRAELSALFPPDAPARDVPPSFVDGTGELTLDASRGDMGIPPAAGQVIMESATLRAHSETFWREEWMCLTRVREQVGVLFYRAYSKSPDIVLSAHDIIGVSLHDDLQPLRMPAVRIDTLGRELYFCFADRKRADAWCAELRRVAVIGDDGGRTAESASAAEEGEYLAKVIVRSRSIFNIESTRLYDEKRRVILNARRLVFSRDASQDPCEVVARALTLLLQCSVTSSSASLVAAFDALSALKGVSCDALAQHSESYRLAFFLNLYHATLLQARLLVGQPSGALGWGDFGSRSCVVVDTGDAASAVSLLEIEHLILRAPMSSAKSFWTKFAGTIAPTPFTRRMALTVPEPRINFCLNYGTQSCLDRVCVFRPDTLDAQLDATSRAFLDTFVDVNASAPSVRLPRMCKWYVHDFTDGVLTSVSSLLPGSKRDEMGAALRAGAKVRNRRFRWKSRVALKMM